MINFIIIGIAVMIVVGFLSSYLIKKNPSTNSYILPGTIVTLISLVIAIASHFTTDGWNAMGFAFLFVFVAVASVIGTLIGKSVGNDNRFS
ncbi:YesK family protein [Neobacillus jeddahensis]|uniref:YesK family protein n=1 Tax=Neobacillus jeddahensis TaxID=1461580 RepID=UPI00058DFF51|nr:YesK family protein [Neobacillus jeddahensis]